MMATKNERDSVRGRGAIRRRIGDRHVHRVELRRCLKKPFNCARVSACRHFVNGFLPVFGRSAAAGRHETFSRA